MHPRLRRVLPAAVAVLVALPLLRAPEQDSYPLSTYPMFATDRGAIHEIATAVRLDPDGTVRRLSPHLIAGTDEVVLASVTVGRAIGRGESEALCAEILDRITGPATVEVRTEMVDVVAHVTDDAPALEIVVHATCET